MGRSQQLRGLGRARRALLAAACVLVLGASTARPGVDGAGVERASTASDGAEATNVSQQGAISADGRYVAYQSYASNLVFGDTNGFPDVFVKDLTTGATTRVSTSSDGQQANGPSATPSLGANGRIAVFWSLASNLVPEDTNGLADVFVKDLTTGVTTLASTSSGGKQGDWPAEMGAVVRADGGAVVFWSLASNLVEGDTNGFVDVFVKDLTTGVTTRASTSADGSESNGDSGPVSVSADGRYVAFRSAAANLVEGDKNGSFDVFVKDLLTGTVTLVSTSSEGDQGDGFSNAPTISADGRYVAFHSDAPNLVPGDTNGLADVFVRDLATGTTTRINIGSGGAEADGWSAEADLSADGRYVAFQSYASNLVEDDQNGTFDVFVSDLVTGAITRVTRDGKEPDDRTTEAAISGDGRYLAFESLATNLVDGDTNGVLDVFRTPRP